MTGGQSSMSKCTVLQGIISTYPFQYSNTEKEEERRNRMSVLEIYWHDLLLKSANERVRG